MKSAFPDRSKVAAKLRPGERVAQYLYAEFERPDLKEGSRLPTVRELAVRLNVSAFTVQTVFQRLAREGRIRTQVGDGTFLVASPRRLPRASFRIALNIPLLHPAPMADWGTRILQEIVQAAARNPHPVMIMPLEQSGLSLQDMARELMEAQATVDALILFPPLERHADEIRAAYEKDGKPVVAINPPALNATANFVSSDFYGACLRLGQVWKQCGRKRVVFVSGPFGSSVSAQLECQGLMAGLETHGRGDITLEILPVRNVQEEEGDRVISALLEGGAPTPDAVFCFGDRLALGVARGLRQHGLNVPEQASVAGATGLDLTGTACPRLTRLDQSFRMLGEMAITMVCERIEKQGISVPGQFVPTRFAGGATTRAEENEMLHISNQ